MSTQQTRPCIDCGQVELPGNYPFTVCDDCWDKKYPPEPMTDHAPGDPGIATDWELLGAAAYADRPLGRGKDRPFGHLDSETKEDWIVIARAVIAAHSAQLRALGYVVMRRDDLIALESAHWAALPVDPPEPLDRIRAVIAATAPPDGTVHSANKSSSLSSHGKLRC